MRGQSWLVAFAVASVVLAAPWLAALESSAWGAAAVGQPAPELRVEAVDGHIFDLSALRGKVVIVNFWATWCPPCREEMPFLDAFYRKHRGEGVELLGLSVDRPRDRKNVGKVMQAFSYPAALIGDAKPNGFGAPRVLPITYVVDPGGIVRAVLTGADDKPMTEQQLADAVLPLLEPATGGH